MRCTMRIKRIVRTILALWFMSTAPVTLSAEANPKEDSVIDPKSISAVQKIVEQDGNLSDEQRKQALEQLAEARLRFGEKTRIEAETETLQAKLQDGPTILAGVRATGEIVTPIPDSDSDQLSTAQLQTLLDERQKQLVENQAGLAASEKELASYITAARTGVGDISNSKQRREALLASTQDATNNANESTLDLVSRMRRTAEAQMLKSRLAWLTLRNNLDQLTELAQTQRDAYAAQASVLQDQVAQLRQLAGIQRKKEAKITEQAVYATLSDVPAELRTLRKEVTELIIEQTALIGKENEIDRRTEQVKRLIEQIGSDYERVQHIVELGGGGAQASELPEKRLNFGPSVKSLTHQGTGLSATPQRSGPAPARTRRAIA